VYILKLRCFDILKLLAVAFGEIGFSFQNNYSVGVTLCFTFNLKEKMHRCRPKTLKLTSLFKIPIRKVKEILADNMI
jgi:hypothetical protein